MCVISYLKVVTAHVILLGEPWAVFLQYAAWQTGDQATLKRYLTLPDVIGVYGRKFS